MGRFMENSTIEATSPPIEAKNSNVVTGKSCRDCQKIARLAYQGAVLRQLNEIYTTMINEVYARPRSYLETKLGIGLQPDSVPEFSGSIAGLVSAPPSGPIIDPVTWRRTVLLPDGARTTQVNAPALNAALFVLAIEAVNTVAKQDGFNSALNMMTTVLEQVQLDFEKQTAKEVTDCCTRKLLSQAHSRQWITEKIRKRL